MVPTEDGTCSSQDVLRRLLEIQHEEDDQLWLLLDTDHYTTGTHLRTFTETLRDARQNGVEVALSRPCFELWLLLHHADEHGVRLLPDASAVEKALRDQLGSYNKTNLNSEHFPLKSVRLACERASRLDLIVEGGEIPQQNTTRLYLLWKSVISKALPSQLPQELRGVFG